MDRRQFSAVVRYLPVRRILRPWQAGPGPWLTRVAPAGTHNYWHGCIFLFHREQEHPNALALQPFKWHPCLIEQPYLAIRD